MGDRSARYERITIRVNPEERLAIRKAARADRRLEGDWARMVLLNAAGHKDADFDDDDDELEDGESYVSPSPQDSPCAVDGCGHAEGAHLHTDGLPDRCMICPTGLATHPYESSV